MSDHIVDVQTEPTYQVRIGARCLQSVRPALQDYERVAVVADAAVAQRYPIPGLQERPVLAVEGGEEAKTLTGLERVLDFLAQAQLDRSSAVLTFGGGMVSDLGGLAASLFKRGLDVWHAPTTLLAQVDASVGGKTAINLRSGKNLAGTFHQPRGVFADTSTLTSLPPAELGSGLGEVLKTALIGGEAEMIRLEERAPCLRRGDPDALAEVVADCVAVKARVVASDPTERGARATLNLGHTLGHAIEGSAGYGRIPHGIAVAVGIFLALDLSLQDRRLEDEGLLERCRALAQTLGLPQSLAELRTDYSATLAKDDLVQHLAHDKKGAVGKPRFVLPRAAGRIDFGVELEPSQVEAVLA